MKLTDLLVQELPKRGGWPNEALYICREGDGTPRIVGSGWHDNISLSGFKVDEAENMVDIEQYEAALAAAQNQVWDGEGLPPVGCRIEALSGGEWIEAMVTYNEPPECHGDAAAWKEVLAFDCKTTRPFWTDEFRPIRTEAERKRSDICDKIYGAMTNAERKDNRSDMAEAVYDAIAAGNIPGIKLEDYQ